MNAQIALREIAAAAADLVNLAAPSRRAINTCADARSIRLDPDRLHFDPVVARSGIAAEKLRHVVDAVDQHIYIAVVIEITQRAAAGRDLFQDSGTTLSRYILELAVAEIP